jgi:hypothetical protein
VFLSFQWQAWQKVILQEGKKLFFANFCKESSLGTNMLLKFNGSLRSTGSYSIVENLGSLAARLIFQPVEEATNNTFSKYSG